ncbi:MAG: M4 family metallopeptidase [Bacteroidia bacterium]|nr:M4 family metallopeptidase [Bacteroidia bacterium]
MRRTLIICLITLLLIDGIYAQTDTTFWNSELNKIAKTTSQPGWIIFRDDVQINPENIFQQHKISFGLKADDDMILYKEDDDNLGFRHYRYQQKHKGIKIEGAEYIVHYSVTERSCKSTNGKLALNLNMNMNVNPSIKETIALQNALNFINSTKYTWETDSLSYLYPIGEIVITKLPGTNSFIQENLRLAYKFKILSDIPFKKDLVYVDAISGNVIKDLPLVYSSNVDVTAITKYNGWVTVTAKERGFPYNDCILKDESRGDGIHTKKDVGLFTENAVCPIAYSGGPYDCNTDIEVEAQAHWGAEMAYDYYLNKFGRNSVDNDGQEIKIFTNRGSDLNAHWDSENNEAAFGKGDGTNANAMVSLDIVGHEITHGVIYNSANLEYSFESGALNESFSDIFGTMVEFYAELEVGYSLPVGQQMHPQDYEIGEDAVITNTMRRSLQNPNSLGIHFVGDDCGNSILGQPDTYNGDFWNTGNCDNGGVHINSGVQNFWFFLLAEGGSGTNDNEDNYNVTGIGREKAAAIAYRNLTVYLTSSSDYSDAKNGAIFAAMDLYGTCSFEVLQTVNAWNAVGVTSANGFGFDVVVNCAELTLFHEGGTIGFLHISPQPYTVRAINDLTANCKITPNGQPVTFIAGNSITLTNGFESGDNFHAFIDPCLAAASRMANNNNSNGQNKSLFTEETIDSNNESGAVIVDNSIINKFSVSPNPSKGKFILNISLTEHEQYSIHVHDITGQLVYERRNLTENVHNLDLSSQPMGIYFVNVIQKDKIYSEKLILQ